MRAAYKSAAPEEAPAADVSVLEILAAIPVMLLSTDTDALESAAQTALAAFQINQDLVGAALQECAWNGNSSRQACDTASSRRHACMAESC
jgi:hypothetical protein